MKFDIETFIDLLDQLSTLNNDYYELNKMGKNTSLVEKEIQNRIVDLKIRARDAIENAFDIPVIMDGELLIYEKAIKKRKFIDLEKTSQVILDQVDVKNDGTRDYYFYNEKEIYRLDIEEESLMTAVRFVNFKKEYPMDKLSLAITALREIVGISYGYRLTLLTSSRNKLDVENIYTGTVFNNSSYSLRSFSLIEKLMLKIKDDYIMRSNSSYSTLDYVIHFVEKRWLIINIKTGATDILNEEEGIICRATFDVQDCFDENNLLANNKDTDIKIETLQTVVSEYISKRKGEEKNA